MSDEKVTRQFGLWTSPITPAGLAGGVRLSDVLWTPDGTRLVWREERSGTGVLVCREGDDAPRELTEGLSVRARVGYGGGDFTVSNDAAFFADQASGRLYRQEFRGGTPVPITPGFGFAASPAVSPDGQWVLYVHTYEGEDRLAVVDARGARWPQVFASGHDFYDQPCWSPDGARVAWIAWDHPNMPFDGTALELARVERSETGAPQVSGAPEAVTGGDEVSVFQPEFLPGGRAIAFVSDRGGWSSLVVRDLESGDERVFTEEETEFGTPAWIQGLRTYAVFGDGRRALVTTNSRDHVRGGVLDLETGELSGMLDPYTFVTQPAVNPRTGEAAAIAAAAAVPPRLVVAGPDRVSVVRRTAAENIPPEALSTPEAYSWTSRDGKSVYGLLFPPASARFRSEGVPPLVVYVHGGPTGQVVATWVPGIQFLATRGYAVLAVNHRGSTGHGREYMTALRGNWGVLDVEDSVSGARALGRDGRVDPERMAIMGGSAGGFTVLQTMVVHPEVFAAGVCLYGVSNQFTLAAETHKLESHYTESLIGPLPAAAALYRERSPQFRASEIRRPLAIFQGEIDEVVPKNQSEAIVAALERSGTPHEYHVYPGEGHGWRKAETIAAYYTALERFLRQWLVYS